MKFFFIITSLLSLLISGNGLAQNANIVKITCHPHDYVKTKPETFVAKCIEEYNHAISLATNKQNRAEISHYLTEDTGYLGAAMSAGLGAMIQMKIDRGFSSSTCELMGKSIKAKNMISDPETLRYLNDPQLSNISMTAIEKMHSGQCKE